MERCGIPDCAERGAAPRESITHLLISTLVVTRASSPPRI
jgi:hypothetical protein